ncbi:MAG TPA: FHA domain-containing protein [Myxococcales bacterium]|nr:FHA domain-containing protein [Myxococcales bacterium]
MAFALQIASGGGRGRRFRFEGEDVRIGRSAECDLILNDAGVSRTHARIQRQGAGWVLIDCGSANGTGLNGAAVASAAPLRKGDRIRVGAVVFRFEPARAKVPVRWRVAGAAGLLLIAAGYAAFVHGRGHGPTPREQEGTVALAWTPPAAPSAEERATASGAEAGPPSAPEAARAAYERGRRKLEERRIAPRNLYDAWSAFSEARRLLEGISPAPALRAELVQSIHDCEQDLSRDCSRLLFAAARFHKYGEASRALQAYRDVLSRFPGDEPSGCRRTAQARLSAAEEAE